MTTAQRNIAAALVVGGPNFNDPRVVPVFLESRTSSRKATYR
jgi:hypothetical protein